MSTSSASPRRASRIAGGGNSIPMAAYSGSYHPPPRPISVRPPLIRSSVATAFARSAAGRNASHNTNVPNVTRGTDRASAPRVTRGSKIPYPVASAPYFARSSQR